MKRLGQFLLRAIVRICFPFRTIEELVGMIENPCHREMLFVIFDEYREIFLRSPASKNGNHPWQGGYLDYVTEVMNIGVVLYKVFGSFRPFEFSLSDMLTVLFLHDLDTPFELMHSVDIDTKKFPDLKDRAAQRVFREEISRKYGVFLRGETLIALQHARDYEYDPISRDQKVGLLFTLCHMAIFLSDRGWPRFPLRDKEDPWRGRLPHSIKHETCSCDKDAVEV